MGDSQLDDSPAAFRRRLQIYLVSGDSLSLSLCLSVSLSLSLSLTFSLPGLRPASHRPEDRARQHELDGPVDRRGEWDGAG